ncbi:MAG: AAA family ATPase [Trichlorobacter sp.]|uniref:bifunctional aminoglycoside phosphotransferase/ATP-binding protein n=1 Tax=Trichlorobacter sp. TaxID=2911007 RepID=UPI00256C1652|nr:bifunctional aminoglycoside phosphotransferase/ATP-binding protein [Trichlorobacter sp.]MDK9716805.1 AAA family ATPase [Trichlorobacter sp.]
MDRPVIDHLLNPGVYPDPTTAVQHLQTHISHLFLTDRFVYKIKKPVDFGFLDFTSLEKRRFYCHEELRLNRRLSPDIYLEVVALYLDADGRLSFQADGPVVEYAVKMLRMPQERMMSCLLEHGGVTETDIDAIAKKVARFHAEAARGDGIALFGTLEAIRSNWLENLRQAALYCGRTLSEQEHTWIAELALQRLEQDSVLFLCRLQQGYIRECDGDLHTENICLDGQVHIFDCIEFNEKFRYSDTAADVAFLAMDLENHGRRDLAELFVERYGFYSGDTGLKQVLPLYLANRAFVRGKVESFRLDDPLIPEEQKTAAAVRAQCFFRLSRGYLLREQLPKFLFLTCGPTGCGKTALADELAFQLGLEHFSSDLERKRLAGVAATERNAAIYSPAWNQATYDRLFELARQCLAVHSSLILDATFLQRRGREHFIRLAADSGARVVILQLSCPDELVRQRLEQRQVRGDSASDGTWQVFQQQIKSVEPPTADEGLVIALDATEEPVAMVEAVLNQLSQAQSETG